MSRYDLIDSPEMMEIGLMAFHDPDFAMRFVTELAPAGTPAEEAAPSDHQTKTGIAA